MGTSRKLRKLAFKKELETNNAGTDSDKLKIYSKVINLEGVIEDFIDYFDYQRLSYFRSYGITLNHKKLILVPMTTPDVDIDNVPEDYRGVYKICITKVDFDKHKVVEHTLDSNTKYYIIVDLVQGEMRLKYETKDDLLRILQLNSEEELESKWEPLTTDFLTDDMLTEFMADLKEKYEKGELDKEYKLGDQNDDKE